WATDGMNSWTRRPVPGADAALAHCLTPEQIMLEGKQPPDGEVVIFDCDGYFMGVSLAEKFASEGRQGTLVTPFPTAGPFLEATGEAAYVERRLRDLHVKSFCGHVVTQIEPGRMRGRLVMGEDDVTWNAESAVLVTHRLSHGLYQELVSDRARLDREGITGLYRVGDCVEPRLIADAIFDGHRLARDIDTDSPASFRPFARENLTVRDADLLDAAPAQV